MAESKIRKWGRGFGVMIPKSMLDELKMDVDEEVVINISRNAITVRKKSDDVTLTVIPSNVYGDYPE